MKIVKEILGRLFALWALIVFAGSLLVASIPIWITILWPEPRRTIVFFKIVHVWMNFFFTFSGVRRIIKGRSHFKKGQNYVVVCNHNSFMDVPLSVAAVPPNKTIAKIEMARIPVFGMIYKRGSVLVDRKNEESRRKSFLKMKTVLEMGLHMCIYPEGTRNRSAEPLQRFHDGAFKLATETRKPVIPAVIFFTSKVLPSNKTFFFWPHRVELHFLQEVAPENKTAQQLKEEVFAIMKNYLLSKQPSVSLTSS